MFDRREFIQTTAVLPLLAAVAQGQQTRLGNLVVDPATAKLTHESFGDLRIYFDGPTDQLHSMTAGALNLKPGMVPHPPHQHPEEEIMLVTAGSGEITVEGKPYPAIPGSMMYCAAGRMHGITAGPQGLTFYFYKWKA